MYMYTSLSFYIVIVYIHTTIPCFCGFLNAKIQLYGASEVSPPACICIIIVIVMFAVITVTINIVLAISPMNVTINSTISSGQLVCPGDQVNFTCETRGSDIIAWTSKEYIGSGGARVEFSFLDVKTMKVDQNTVATLISADNVNGIRTLISRLTITVSPSYQNPSITCLHVGRLINATISFVVPGKYYNHECSLFYPMCVCAAGDKAIDSVRRSVCLFVCQHKIRQILRSRHMSNS